MASMKDDNEEREDLKDMRMLPPFSSYPLIGRKVLVEESTNPSRPYASIIKFTFAYPIDQCLPVSPTTQYVKLIRPGLHKPRSYTPTSGERKGEFDLVVKIYRGGGTSEWLSKQPLGETISFIGPLPPSFKRAYNPGKHVVILALGIGITLGYGAAREELERENTQTVTLLYGVRYKEERVFTHEIGCLESKYGDKFRVRYVASKDHVDGWIHGRINQDVISQCIQGMDKDETRFLVVGTKSMYKSMWETLGRMGYKKRMHNLA